MDPLSITASTITLIQATGIVATALGSFMSSMRTVDSRLTNLCDELTSLTGFLQAIDSTLKTCHKLDLDQIDERLWQQSEIALANCQTTLNEMSQLVSKIKASSRKRVFWKARVVIDLGIHGDDLVFYRDKIHHSNSGLQTMLHAMHVSLSLRSNAAQSLIVLQLSRLKASIDEALYTSSKEIGGSHNASGSKHTDGHISRNLRQLAEAAQSLHTSASSTASTIRSSRSARPEISGSIVEPSLLGELNASRKEHIQKYLADYIFEPPTAMPSSARSSRILSPHDTEASKEPSIVDASGLLSPAASDINSVEDDDEAEFEQEFLSILKELAYYNMTSNNYEKAVKFLHQAIARHEETKAGGQDYRNLRAQLALCYILQHQWQLAEPLVMELHETSDEEEMTIWILFHALALGYLSEYAFDNALAACKLALKGKKALCKSRKADWGQYHETLALSSTILEVKGDYIRAEVFRRRLPADFKYSHPKNGALFIEAQKELLLPSMRGQMQALRREEGLTRLQENTDVAQGQLRNRSFWETTGVEQESDLTTKLSLHEKQELDTTKECIVDEHPFESDSDTEVAPIDAVHLPSVDQLAENKTMSSPVSVPIPKQNIEMAYGNSHADFIIQVDFDSKYPVETGTPHSSVPLGAAPWSSRFHKKSKTLLRKRRVGTEKVHPSKLGQCSCGQIIPGFDSRGGGEGESADEISSNDSSSSCETVVNAGRAARSNRKKVLSGSPNFVILGKLWWRRKVMRRDTKDDDAGQRIIAWMRAQQSHDNAICKPSHMPAESELDSRSLGIWPTARRSCATPERPDGPDGRAMRFEMDPECVTELWDTSSPAVVDSIAFSPMGISPMESLVEHPGDDGQLQKEGNQLLNIDGPVGALHKMRPLGSPTGVPTKPSMLQESLGRMVTAVISIETPQEQVAMKRKQDALVALLLELRFLSCDESLFSDLRKEISWISEEIRLIEGQSEDEAGGTSTVATTGEAMLVAKLLVPSVGEHGNNCSDDLCQGPERFDEDSIVVFRPSQQH